MVPPPPPGGEVKRDVGAPAENTPHQGEEEKSAMGRRDAPPQAMQKGANTLTTENHAPNDTKMDTNPTQGANPMRYPQSIVPEGGEKKDIYKAAATIDGVRVAAHCGKRNSETGTVQSCPRPHS